MESRVIAAFADELTKIALLERLVRIGATDIPGTPRLIMKHRPPAQLRKLQDSVANVWNTHITNPIESAVTSAANPVLKKMPGRIKPIAKGAIRQFAKDPVGFTASNLVPVPGANAAYLGGKALLEKAIDKALPLAQ